MMLHGRTDVIRTLTTESREFVRAMLDPEVDVSPVSSVVLRYRFG